MTRLEAIKSVRKGERLDVVFTPQQHGVSDQFLVAMFYMGICNFPRHRQPDHDRIGPIHCLFFSGVGHWIHVTPKQLLGFIRRNFTRK